MKRMLTGIALFGLLAAAMPAWAQTPEPAELAPADALGFVGITDTKQLWDDFKSTASYQALQDETFAKVAGGFDFGSLSKAIRVRIADFVGISADKLENPFAGPLAIYVTAPTGGGPDDVVSAFVAGVGDASLMRQYYDSTTTKLKEQMRHMPVQSGSYTIDVFKSKSDGEGGDSDEFDDFDDGGFDPTMLGSSGQVIEELLDEAFSPDNLPKTMATCLTDDKLIIATSEDEVRAILRRSPGDNTLAGVDDYKKLLRELRPIGQVRVLVNLPRIIEIAKANVAESEASDLRQVLQVIGAESLRSAVGHVAVGASAYQSKSEFLILMTAQRTGVAKLISMENRPTTPPPFIGTDALFAAVINLNVPEFVDEVERMVRQQDPEAADEMHTSLEAMPIGPDQTLNIRQDLLAHLQPPLTFTLSATKPIGPGAVRIQQTLGHHDQAALVRFLGMFQGFLMPRDVRGTQVFDFTIMPGFAVAPTSDRIAVGSTPAVEAALEGSAAQSLAQSDVFKRAARFVPEQAWMTLFVNDRMLMEFGLELAKNKDQLMANPMMAMDPGIMILSSMLQGVMDLEGEDITAAAKMLKYSAQTIFTITTIPEGLRITALKLNPE